MNIAVYCSAKDIIPEEYLALGDEVGKWIAEHHHNLVYGGATGGLMSRVSQAFKASLSPTPSAEGDGSTQKLIGVIPNRIKAAGRLASYCDELVEVANMNERKQQMKERSDCFICLPGSYGTLDEMYDVIASGTVGEHHKPCFILNHNGFYNGLIAEAAHMKSLMFLPKEESYKPLFVETTVELFTAIEAVKPAKKA